MRIKHQPRLSIAMRWLANRRVCVAHAANAREACLALSEVPQSRSGSAARAQYNEENTASPHRATLAKGVKEKERESLHLKTSHHIWTGSPQPGGGTRDLIYTVLFSFVFSLFLFWGKDCERLRAKMMVGEMEVNERPRPKSRLSHAVTEREEAHDEFTKPERDLHTPGETLGRR